MNNHNLTFHGKGSTYFGIVAINFILTALTLGLYYPWAKAKYRNYLWNETEFQNSRFVFHGTGREMFKGFLIAYVVFVIFYVLYFMIFSNPNLAGPLAVIGFITFMIFVVFLFTPFAIFSSWRYRVSRTSWRGIYFSFSASFSENYKLYIKYLLLTIVTFGIAFPWLRVSIQQYLIGHTRLGSLKLDFHGEGGTLFGINLLGYILLYPTLFLYVPFFLKNRFNFTINNTTLSDDKVRRSLVSHLQGWDFFGVLIVNLILLVFTFGLAFPFTKMRAMKAMYDTIELPNDIDYDEIIQNADAYNQATGEEMLDLLDIDIDF